MALAALWVCLAQGLAPARAQVYRYALDVIPGQPVAYSIEIEVPRPGTLSVDAEWPGNRVLSFRLDSPAATEPAARRSGPSPQRMQFEVEPATNGAGRIWRLSIRGLAGREGGEGRLSIELPAEPEPVEPPPTPEPTPPPPAAVIPAHLPATWRTFATAAAEFGAGLDRASTADVCRWQADLASFLEDKREALLESGAVPAPETRASLHQLVDAIQSVEALRTSTDPILAGPPPDDPDDRRFWLRLRETRILEIEDELDRALQQFRRGHAPELERQDWPLRLISCVMACERHFEERVRLGERRAANLDLTRAEWRWVMEGALALEAFVEIEDPLLEKVMRFLE